VRAKENPAVVGGASEVSGGDLDTTILAPIQPRASKRLALSVVAETWITERASELATGQLGLWELPPSLVEFYYVAFFAGRDSQASELAQARRDADRYYGLAFNPPPAINHSAKTFAELEATRAAIYGGASV
jgi:hypothetical protein